LSGSDFTVSFELYDVSTEGLIDKFVDKAKNADGLLAIMQKKIPDGFRKIPGVVPEAKTALPSVDGETAASPKAKTAPPSAGGETAASPKAKTALPSVDGEVSGGMFTDSRDGKKYKAVKIGSQTWMAENLDYAASSSKCYENNSGNCAKYGRLYDWATAKNVCPSGWHLPSKSEYEVLDKAVGGEKVAGKKLKAKSGWNKNGNGTDEFGFRALPGGNGYSDGSFHNVGYYGNWWSATEFSSYLAYIRSMDYDVGSAYWYNYHKSYYLYSVRCLQD
jgi:uncharacterized protein (TIGR02145 family)